MMATFVDEVPWLPERSEREVPGSSASSSERSESTDSHTSSCGRRGRTLGPPSRSLVSWQLDHKSTEGHFSAGGGQSPNRRCAGDFDVVASSELDEDPASSTSPLSPYSWANKSTGPRSSSNLSCDYKSTSVGSTGTGEVIHPSFIGRQKRSLEGMYQPLARAQVLPIRDDAALSGYEHLPSNDRSKGSAVTTPATTGAVSPTCYFSPSTAPSHSPLSSVRDLGIVTAHYTPSLPSTTITTRKITSEAGLPLKTPSTPSGHVVASVAAMVTSIVMYTTISLAIVYFNWWLFTGSFRFPIFVSWIQQVFGLILFVLLAFIGQRVSLFKHFPLLMPQWRVMRRVAPLSLAFVGMVGLANLCLKYVQVSTYQVARSLTLFFTLALSWIMLGDTQSRRVVFACSIMVVGFIIGSMDTKTLSLSGLLAGAASSLFQAIYNVAIKQTLQRLDGDPNVLLFYNLCISCFLFLPLIILFGEVDVVHQLRFDFRHAEAWAQWGSLFCTGFLATAMNLSSYFCVKCTSPLTFNIVGFTKSIFQTMGGFLFLGDLVSAPSLIGVVLSLGGSGLYSWNKIQELSMSNQASSPDGGGGTLRAAESDDGVETIDMELDVLNGEASAISKAASSSGELLYPLSFPTVTTKRHQRGTTLPPSSSSLSIHDAVEEEMALLHSTLCGGGGLTIGKASNASPDLAATPVTTATAPASSKYSPLEPSP